MHEKGGLCTHLHACFTPPEHVSCYQCFGTMEKQESWTTVFQDSEQNTMCYTSAPSNMLVSKENVPPQHLSAQGPPVGCPNLNQDSHLPESNPSEQGDLIQRRHNLLKIRTERRQRLSTSFFQGSSHLNQHRPTEMRFP